MNKPLQFQLSGLKAFMQSANDGRKRAQFSTLFTIALIQALNNNLNKEDRFSTEMVLEKCPDLGLVIDLTNTKRYYNNLEFLSKGVCYKKIFCPGRVVPPPGLLSQFIKNVDDFLNKTQDKLIGVHCTHGVNRTGYFICSYMIRRLGMSPQEAISEFEKARGHRIERDLYVEELQKGSEKPLPPAPVEDEEEVTGNRLDGPGPKKRERHRNRKRKEGGGHPVQPDSSDNGFQQGHFNHDRNARLWPQGSNDAYEYPQFREPYRHNGPGRPAMPSSSGPNRPHQEHISPLSGAYDDDDRSSFSRYGNRQGPVRNYQGYRSTLDGAYGSYRDRNNSRQSYNDTHWYKKSGYRGSRNTNSGRS